MTDPKGPVEVEVGDYLAREFYVQASPRFAVGISGSAVITNPEQAANQDVKALSGVSWRTFWAVSESFSGCEQQELRRE